MWWWWWQTWSKRSTGSGSSAKPKAECPALGSEISVDRGEKRKAVGVEKTYEVRGTLSLRCWGPGLKDRQGGLTP
jgi:hypothetical protein